MEDMIVEVMVMIMDLEDTITAMDTVMDTIMAIATIKSLKPVTKVTIMVLEAAADTITDHPTTTVTIMTTPQLKQKVKQNKNLLKPKKITLNSNKTPLYLETQR